MKIHNFSERVEFPKDVSVSLAGKTATVKGQKGEITKNFNDPNIQVSIEEGALVFKAEKYTKKQKTLMGTYKSHLKNMIAGATRAHEYSLKICSGHFPMNVSYSNNMLQVKNFMGEKTPRKLAISKEVELKLDGDKITLSGIDKNKVSQAAGSIEQLTRRSNFDKRVFQDGIYIVNKDGKEIK